MSEIDSQVTCSVCLSDYNEDSQKQKFLPCLHSFCQSCLKQVKQSDIINCPICRKEVHISSGDISSLPDTNFGVLREIERQMKEIELKERNQTRKIQELKQEKEKISEQMNRKIAEKDERINRFRWSNSRLVHESNELKRVKQSMEIAIATKDQEIHSLNELKQVKQSMETAIATKDQEIHSLKEFVTEIELGKKFEDTKYRKKAEKQEEEDAEYWEEQWQSCDNAFDDEYLQSRYHSRADVFEHLWQSCDNAIDDEYLGSLYS